MIMYTQHENFFVKKRKGRLSEKKLFFSDSLLKEPNPLIKILKKMQKLTIIKSIDITVFSYCQFLLRLGQ